ncbi:hypothetical protein KAFR_0C05800 [Kazachstania africana CBS 2517]|uniref:Secreted protein CSS2 C-terminal domain-containing protein n=1 Tax=Kazachstania africana (strain ATCC 22294 / BCRC 22015 / CBS 2517 / CECT 1963 / NBRC 1671 / NRRL Y-8276) TaxID=1071382 RepID=H2AT71_KAZAF|nr:hypothetical protein KAFR_0C05800 [Kazachstania africana CBS 2517]CCF57571.1 hypothetical protein KAFR_0C05800 [Kazachstania africana CBS 2517]
MRLPTILSLIFLIACANAEEDWHLIYPRNDTSASSGYNATLDSYTLYYGTPPRVIDALEEKGVHPNTTLLSTEIVLNHTAIQMYASDIIANGLYKRGSDEHDVVDLVMSITQALVNDFYGNQTTTLVKRTTWCSTFIGYIKDSTAYQAMLASDRKFKAKYIGEGISSLYHMGLDVLSMAANIASITKSSSSATACYGRVETLKYTSGNKSYRYTIGIYPYTAGSKCDTTLTTEEIEIIIGDMIEEGEKLKSAGWCTTLTHSGTWRSHVKVMRVEVSEPCHFSLGDIQCPAI